MVVEQRRQRFNRRFLQHTFQFGGFLARRDKHPVVFGYLWSEPQSVANDVGIGYSLQRLGGAYVDIAAHYHRVQSVGGLVHYAAVERHLQRKQVLRKALSALPTEYRQRSEYLARRGIRRKPAALSARMQQQPFVGCEPFVETFALVFGIIGSFQKPRRSATRT